MEDDSTTLIESFFHLNLEESLVDLKPPEALDLPSVAQISESISLIHVNLPGGGVEYGTGFLGKMDERIGFFSAGHVIMTKNQELADPKSVNLYFNDVDIHNNIKRKVALFDIMKAPHILICAVDGKMIIVKNGREESKKCSKKIDFFSILFTETIDKTTTFLQNHGLPSYLTVAEPEACHSEPGRPVMLTGFPQFDGENFESPMRPLNGMERTVPNDSLSDILHDAETTGGASGCPVLNKPGKVKAVHVHGNANGNGNGATSFYAIRQALSTEGIFVEDAKLQKPTIGIDDANEDRSDNELPEKNDYYQKATVDIAVVGMTGVGKSSWINQLRGIKDRRHPLWAKVGIGATECTKEATPYAFEGNDNLTLWDLPGANTKNFPMETYDQDLNFDRFNAFVILSQDRFEKIDSDVANLIFMTKKPCFFARTCIDKNIDNEAKQLSRERCNSTEMLEKLNTFTKEIRENFQGTIKDQESKIIPSEVFLLTDDPIVRDMKGWVPDNDRLKKKILEALSDLLGALPKLPTAGK